MSFSENDTVEVPFSIPNILNDFMDILSFCCEIRSYPLGKNETL